MIRIYSYKGDKYLIKAFSEYLNDLGYSGENRGMSQKVGITAEKKEGEPNFINVYPDKEKYIICDFPHRNPFMRLSQKWEQAKYKVNTGKFPVTEDVGGLAK